MDQTEAKQLLMSTGRQGMDNLIAHLEKIGYFSSPASTRFHGSYEGGLVDHCASVHKLFSEFCKLYCISTDESQIIVLFLHDVCKAGAYQRGCFSKYEYNRCHPEGHALLSLEIIKKFIELTTEEEMIIKYHMGVYSSKEYAATTGYLVGEYSVAEMVNAFNFLKAAKLFHYCDDMSSQFEED